MRDLHPNVAGTAKEVLIKESEGFRLRLEKWEGISPKGLYALDIVQESLNDKGEVWQTSTYSFNMTQEELKSLATGLLA